MLDTFDWKLIQSFSPKLTSLLRQYYFIGGMPEAVSLFLQTGNLLDARAIQNQILLGYERDMSKHLNRTETEYTLSAWNSIPSHLAQENKKFIFSHIKDGARAKNYRFSLTWLTQAGLTYYIPRVSKPGIPLGAYEDTSAFKLFVLDVGLLGAMTNLDQQTIIKGNNIFTEFKGALTEQYVCQQLISDCNFMPYYWSAQNSRGEIDFLTQSQSKIYPIEVKAEENLRSKSLMYFNEKYPEMNPRRFSLSGFREESWMTNIPLYAIGCTKAWY